MVKTEPFYRKEVARVQAWLKGGLQRYISQVVHFKIGPIKNCCERIRMHKIPIGKSFIDTKKWKINVTRIDSHFAYRIDQATIGSGAKQMTSQNLSQKRRVFRWHLKETQSLAAKNLSQTQRSFPVRLRKYTSFAHEDEEAFQKLLSQNYLKEDEKTEGSRLFRIDRI